MFLFFLFLCIPWFITVVQRVLVHTMLWQTKEYRLDRLCAHFSTEEGKKFLRSEGIHMLLDVFYLSNLWYAYAVVREVPIPLILYGVLVLNKGTDAIRAIARKTIPRPRFTKKTLLIVAFSLFILFFPLTVITQMSGSIWDRTDTLTAVGLLTFLDILLPWIIAIVVGILRFPTWTYKQKIKKEAEKKILHHPHLTIIGITGSYGKTSTKEFLYTLLSKKYSVFKTEKNNNTPIGIAQTILSRLTEKHQIGIIEMGAYRRGEIKEICDFVHPKMGIITAIADQHLALFGSIENIQKTKWELVESLPSDGCAVLNFDSFQKSFGDIPTTREPIWYSIQPHTLASITGISKQSKANQEIFDLSIASRHIECTLSLTGTHWISNFLAAAAVAHHLGMTLEEIAHAAQDIQPPNQAIERKKGRGGCTILDDSYNANPEGVIAALSVLQHAPGKKILLMPGMIELGNHAKMQHTRIGKAIGNAVDICILTNMDFASEIMHGAKEASTKINIVQVSEPKKICEILKEHLTPHTTILIESRVPEAVIHYLLPTN